jgi:hypothetical protein
MISTFPADSVGITTAFDGVIDDALSTVVTILTIKDMGLVGR